MHPYQCLLLYLVQEVIEQVNSTYDQTSKIYYNNRRLSGELTSKLGPDLK